MKILLDTHILLWYFEDNARLSLRAREIIEDEANEIYYSLLSVWEVEIKHVAHPDRISMTGENFIEYCKELNFTPVPVDVAHVLEVKNLVRRENTPRHHDPFDRLMICQAIVEGMTFMTHDARIAEYVSDSIYKI